jgi:exosortase
MSRSRPTYAVAGIALGLVYLPVVAALARVWWTDTYAAHGLLVLPFSAFVAWSESARLRRVPARPGAAGLVALAFGLALLGVGQLASSLAVQALSLVVVVAGFVWWAFGRDRLAALAFPVGFLAFMVPLPRAVVNAISHPLQAFAARVGAEMAAAAGVPVYQSGIHIELPRITLEVAELCNGLRFLTALVVLAVALAHVSQRSLPRKLVLVGASIPLAIGANAFRVGAIALAVYYLGPQAASGWIHHGIGKLAWALTLAPLAVLAVILRANAPAPRPAQITTRSEGYESHEVRNAET